MLNWLAPGTKLICFDYLARTIFASYLKKYFTEDKKEFVCPNYKFIRIKIINCFLTWTPTTDMDSDCFPRKSFKYFSSNFSNRNATKADNKQKE